MATVAPESISSHLNQDDLPWAQWGEGVWAKVLRVSRETGTWVLINRFAPGTRIPTHHHDGSVHAWTLKGRWHYLEYDFVATPGSFVFEEAGSTHTLEALADNEEPVEVFFVIEGGLILYDDDGNMFGFTDARAALDLYYGALDAAGVPRPEGIIQ
ncbi:MAG: 2,4'-dihydroxyacetophenone dioxygenase family protein [Acidimicrobiia bacterium]